MSYSYHIGDLSEKYEIGNKGVGFISNGSKWGDPGGDSYGSYQLETKQGTMQGYLKRSDKYTERLKKFTINSPEFKATWRALAAEDPEGFKQSQFDYLCHKPGGYNDAIKWANENGWAADNFAFQSAIYSTVNQSGNWKFGIFARAGIEPTDTVASQINKLYDARAAYFRRIKLSDMIRRNIIRQRTVEERRDCLKLLGK